MKYTGEVANRWLPELLGWIVPLLFFVGIWGFFFRRMGGAEGGVMSFARSRAKIYADDEVKVRFTDVAGVDEAEDELKEIVEFLKNPKKYTNLGGRIPKGVLLVGPPGTGKTLLARAVAGEAHVPFFSLSGSEFVEMFVGVGAARIRDLFQQAEAKAPCIVFIDELDALGKARMQGPFGGHEEREQTLNQLLAEMDGFDSRKGVIIMGATNRPEVLDAALLRPGRFDRQVLVDKPDVKGREEILRIHTRGVKTAPNVDLKVVAARTAGFAGADLANLVNEAALLAARTDKVAVEMKDFEAAIDRLIAGLEKKRVMSTKERRIVAYHESGHAIVATVLPGLDPVHKISIVQRGFGALGYTMQLPLEDRYLMTRGDLYSQLAVLLGGRTAEEIALGEISTGAQNDLQRATDIARAMVTEFGMSDALGAINYDGNKRARFLDIPMPQERGLYGEDTAQKIDAEIKRILTDAHDTARQILTEPPRQAGDRHAAAARGRGHGRRRAAPAARGQALPPSRTDAVRRDRRPRLGPRRPSRASAMAPVCPRCRGQRGFGGRLEADLRMRAVAERLVRRPAAAAQRERPLRDLILVAVPVDQRHIVALDEIRTVLPHLDRRHSPSSRVNPSSASTPGTRRSSSSSTSCRAAAPSPRPATAG